MGRTTRSILRGAAGIALAVGVALGGGRADALTAAEISALLEARLAEPWPGSLGSARTYAPLQEFYQRHGYRPVWVTPEGPTPFVAQLAGILRAADREGLSPQAYETDRLEEGLGGGDAEALAELELLASRELLRYVSDLRTGRLSPREVDSELFIDRGDFGMAEVLDNVLTAPHLTAVVGAYTPSNPYYRRLRRVLLEYRKVAAAGGWPTVPAGPKLTAGMTDPRVAALRRRLQATADLLDGGGDPDFFDDRIEQAVIRFQRRHGLDADGVVGRNTLAALNEPIEERIEQILVNMERWRWMPDDLGDRYILVNLAGFEVDVVEDGRTIIEMPVVVGRPYRRTPVFSGLMTYLEFNPTWTVPPNIARKDILPKAQQDPAYLAGQKIRVFNGWDNDAPELDPLTVDWKSLGNGRVPYRLRQDAGPNNALGRVKFMLPNRFDVYLHDTPSRELFAKSVRAFSSGCIRLKEPMRLAEYVLADVPGWDRARIDSVVASGKTTVVRLPQGIPVHLTYSTVWFGEGGTIHFRDDVYGRDGLLLKALFGRVPKVRQAREDR